MHHSHTVRFTDMKSNPSSRSDSQSKSSKSSNADDKTLAVTVRLNASEMALLNRERARVNLSKGAYLRGAALAQLPKVIPSINRQVWGSLMETQEGLARVNDWLDENPNVDRACLFQALNEIATNLSRIRREALGLSDAREGEE